MSGEPYRQPTDAESFNRQLCVRLAEMTAILTLLRAHAMTHAPTLGERLRITETIDLVRTELNDLITSCSHAAVELPLKNVQH